MARWADHTLFARKRLALLFTFVLLFLTLVIYNSSCVFDSIPTSLDHNVEQQPATEQLTSIATPEDLAANSTLGFEKILALSAGPSWRTRGLEAAAEITGLDIIIPPQPPIPDEVIDIFQHIGEDIGVKQPKRGSAKAWLAHLDLLRFVIASRFETAFIIEDDVDWDLAIRSQMSLVSMNVRNYTNAPSEDPTPFGSNWDILWLGHCGAWVKDDMREPFVYLDETRIDMDHYSGWSRQYIKGVIPEGHRQVQDCLVTVCTFGYGVSRRSAPKILGMLTLGKGEAFDVMLHTFCSTGKLKCVVVNPQLFNHYEPPVEEGYVSVVHAGDGLADSSDDSVFEGMMGFTGNIVESARCKALFNETCVRPGSDM